jgi:hypothetical protein
LICEVSWDFLDLTLFSSFLSDFFLTEDGITEALLFLSIKNWLDLERLFLVRISLKEVTMAGRLNCGK